MNIAVERPSPQVPGTGPINHVILFAGIIFAARSGRVWRLTDDGWVEVCLEVQK